MKYRGARVSMLDSRQNLESVARRLRELAWPGLAIEMFFRGQENMNPSLNASSLLTLDSLPSSLAMTMQRESWLGLLVMDNMKTQTVEGAEMGEMPQLCPE